MQKFGHNIFFMYLCNVIKNKMFHLKIKAK